MEEAQIRDIAEKQLVLLQSSYAQSLDEHSATFRWLMASLLTLNGAGILAVKDHIAGNEYWAILSCISFYLGISCSLLIARFGQKSIQKILVPLGQLIGFWMNVANTGEFDDDIHNEKQLKLTTATKSAIWSKCSSWGAFIFFSLGLALGGVAYTPSASDPKAKLATSAHNNEH